MRLYPAITLGLLAAAALPAAQAQKIAPGLWEAQMRLKSASGQIEAEMARMQQEMAKLPPDQRKMMQDMMARQGVSVDPAKGLQSARYCISKEQAERGEVPADPEGRCRQEKVERSGSTMRFAFVCTNPPSRGSGEITLQGDKAYTSKVTVDSTGQDGRPERMEMTQQARWVSGDCGALKPLGGGK